MTDTHPRSELSESMLTFTWFLLPAMWFGLGALLTYRFAEDVIGELRARLPWRQLRG